MKPDDPDRKKEDRRCFLIKIGALAAACAGKSCMSDTNLEPDAGIPDGIAHDAADAGTDAGHDAGLPDGTAPDGTVDGTVDGTAHDAGDAGADGHEGYYVDPNRCDGCGKCVNDFICPLNAITLEGECEVYLDPEKYCYWQCRTYECIDLCPQGAILMGLPPKQMGFNIHIDQDLCNCCGDCIPSCFWLGGVIVRDSNRIAIIDPVLCNDCGLCNSEFICPQTAIFYG